MASYPQSLARVTHPQMSNSKGQPRAVAGKQNGMMNAAARRLQKSNKKPIKPLSY